MSRPSPIPLRSRSGSRQGVAVVIVLAVIALLSIVILSLIAFTRLNRASSFSYAKSVQAQEIARGGLYDIIDDLHKEIIAGSMTDSTGTLYTQGSTTVYVPWTNLTAQPARIGYAPSAYGADTGTATLSPTLIRVSRATGNPNASGGDSFFTTLTTGPYTNNMAAVPGTTILNRASLASTSSPSYNGRTISAARWNESYLLATNAAAVPSPFTTAPPDWVYVTQTGSRVCNISTDTLTTLLPSANPATSYGTVTAGVNPPASPIVGRYAFVMYDEGALLDANVVGYTHLATNMVAMPTLNNPAGIGQTVNHKSYTSYADLTMLPGIGASSAAIDAFVTWRNASAAATPGTTIPGVNYLDAAYSYAQSGFLSFQSNSTTGASDSPLVSRQDLINYFASIDPKIGTGSATFSQALPYLGTFSREVNAPTWTPTADSQNMLGYTSTFQDGVTPVNVAPVAYKTNAEKATDSSGNYVANRDLPNVRFLVPSTSVKHYNDSGVATTYSVNVGDPLLQHRFSLARISWLSGVDPVNGPTANQTAITDCFGLTWGTDGYSNSSYRTGTGGTIPSGSAYANNPCWNYVHGSSTGGTLHILTLGEVAALNPPREPDFFELLKAGILSGSVGKDPGLNANTGAWPATTYEGCGSMFSNLPTSFQNKDMQVLQIGANIIDQFTSDGNPTAIYFPQATEDVYHSPLNVVYGLKNLPYLTCIRPGSLVTSSGMVGWYQPDIWNPFQQPASLPSSQPTQFRLRAYGSVYLVWQQVPFTLPTPPLTTPTPHTFQGAEVSGTGPTLDYGSDPAGAFLYFSDAGQFYNAPVSMLKTTLGTPSTANNPLNLYPSSALGDASGSSKNLFAGIYTGTAPYTITTPAHPPTAGTPNQAYDIVGQYVYGQNQATPGSGPATYLQYYDYPTDASPEINYQWMQPQNVPAPTITFCLQYRPSGSATWLPYSYMSRLDMNYESDGDPDGTYAASGATTTDWIFDTSVNNTPIGRADPLTDRMSVMYTDGSHGDSANYAHWTFNETMQGTPSGTLSVSSPGGSAAPQGLGMQYAPPARASGFFYHNITPQTTGTGYDSWGLDWTSGSGWQGLFGSMWSVNQPQAATGSFTLDAYYADPDGVIRPGNDYLRSLTSFDGFSLLPGAYKFPTATSVTGSVITTGIDAMGRRPLILNRPFRSVGELGYANRDLPGKTLDFFTQYSADAALLDLFSVTDEPSLVAGRVNLSNAPNEVLQALLNNELKQEYDTGNPALDIITTGGPMKDTQAVATSINSILLPTGASPNPMLNRADLATRLGSVSPTNKGMLSGLRTRAASPVTYEANKTSLEAPVRALAGVSNTRTWNLMIDIIAQSGRLASTASSLNDFIVEGEKRYWLHIAIDRYTGAIVDEQLEPVYE